MAPTTRQPDLRQPPTVQQTLQSLDSAAGDSSLASISGLGLPQVRELKAEIAEIFPASNLPGFLLQGLLQLKGRTLDGERVSMDLRVLFRETRQIGLYSTFLAAPALIIYGYQRLLTLAGKDVDSAFPDGTWQFYTEFGLREDAARHSVETRGFAAAGADLPEAAAAACWAAAAIHTLLAYDDLLACEWHERVLLRCVDLALAEQAAGQKGLPAKGEKRAQAIAAAAEQLRQRYGLGRLAAAWAARRPYAGPANSPIFGYAEARRRSFDSFLERQLRAAPAELRARAEALYAERRMSDLPAYQRQMQLLQALLAESYSDQRQPLAISDLRLAFVCGGHYFLLDPWERDAAGNLRITPRDGDPSRPGQSLPLRRAPDGAWSDPYGQPATIDRRGEVRVAEMRIGRLRPLPLAELQAQIGAIMRQARPLRPDEPGPPGADLLLAASPRRSQEALRQALGTVTRGEVEQLRLAPIIINWDQHDPDQPLPAIRRTRRGCGDHALTILRAGAGAVFDMSHIFFDGIWGAILAEIVTGFACALAGDARGLRPAQAPAAPAALGLARGPAFERAAREALALAQLEVSAETRTASLSAINGLRRRMAEREMDLTVNDILLLGRYHHAASYQPGPAALAALDDMQARGGEATRLHDQIAQGIVAQRSLVPSLLVPMDASWIDPRQRLHPATLRNPQPDLLPRLERCEQLLRAVVKQPTPGGRQTFEAERTDFCRNLIAYAAVLRALRAVTTRGESFTTGALKLLAHLPRPMQSLMDQIPQKIDLLNEIVKGGEVFSNIGQVARSSSVARFASARDDGDTKLLIWGLMADSRGQLVITLRDFRPHVASLLQAGYTPMAELLAADFLETYAEGLNQLVRRIQRVLAYK